jgi:hypothetical protein
MRSGSLVSNLEEVIQVLLQVGEGLGSQASSDRFESDPSSPGAAQIEVT